MGAVEVWLGRVSAGSRRSHLVRRRAFVVWLSGQPGSLVLKRRHLGDDALTYCWFCGRNGSEFFYPAQ